ncbi:dipeptidase [Hyphodiscus hymeniophilus]|uniref:Dipeptidase n=1 Tax=Hyphodiscus hymeniophilus TaxID=353542 RepID=A0A9P6SLF2_9HELO|nr:dipeptidase [Hyphodiscus hymeniophilus]
MAYNYYKEVDPLLPNDKRAPEIQGSRPQSINDEYIIEEQVSDDKRELRRKRNGLADLMALVFGIAFFASIILVLFPDGPLGDLFGDKPPTPKTLDERVTRILEDTPLIDGHNDLAIMIRLLYGNHIYDDKFKEPFEKGGLSGHVDLPRLKKGKNGGAFWAAYVPCPKNGTDFSDENYFDSIDFTLTQLDVLTRLQAAYPAHFSTPPNGTTALSAFKAGQLISPLAIEGLHQIGNKASNLRLYHSLGVRYATLTHNCHNIYADAALAEGSDGVEKAKPLHGGVTDIGKDLIKEMNRIGMIVDISHVSVDTMRDVLGGSDSWSGSDAPIMFSHSSAYAVCPHPRNVPDDILQLVKKSNSVVMVNFAPDFVSCVANPDNQNGMPDTYPPNSTLSHVVTHIKHIGDLIGYDYVGLGSDFDGIPSTPKGLDDVSKFPDLVKEMLERGVSDEDAGKVVGGNILRVWKDVDIVAAKMQAEGVAPLEDKLPAFKLDAFAEDMGGSR